MGYTLAWVEHKYKSGFGQNMLRKENTWNTQAQMGRIIFKKQNGMVWAALILFKIGTSGGLL